MSVEPAAVGSISLESEDSASVADVAAGAASSVADSVASVADVAADALSKAPRVTPVRLVALAGRMAAVWLAVFVPYVASRPLAADSLAAVTISAAIWLVALRGAYSTSPRAIGVGVPAVTGAAAGLVGVAAVNPWFPGLQVGLGVLIGTCAGVALSSASWEWSVRATSAGRRRVLLVGDGDLAAAIAAETRLMRRCPFTLIGRVEPAPDLEPPSQAAGCLGDIELLAAVVSEHRPDIIVLADEAIYAPAVDRLLDVARPGLRVVGLSSFFEYAFGRVPFESLTPAWFMCLFHLRQPLYARWAKRSLDVCLATVGLVVALPVLPLIAVLVRRSSGPLLYRQARLGAEGRPFTMYKFRSMVCGAEAQGAQWASEGDTRLAPGGGLLRRTHLDEIPQLINVLKGEMSIVGPRPERPEFVNELESSVPFWSRRLLVRPGLTGWAQVRYGYASDCESAAAKLSYDLWYVRNQGLTIDLAVCVKTAALVLGSLLPSFPGEEEELAHEQRTMVR